MRMDVRRYIREVAGPLVPEATGVDPKLKRLEGIRAVALDIYGTLLISEAGDVSSGSNERNLEAMLLVCERLDGIPDPSSLLEEFESAVSLRLSQARLEGVAYPEVEIREVWREILTRRLPGAPAPDLIEEVAVVYECASNPVWPMPGATELLKVLTRSGLKLGIISNAQFYTPMVMEELFRKSLPDLGFSEDWSTFSYTLREGKPSPAIYEKSKEGACELGLSPDEVLYVGNDMRKDILPAASVGYRTCLFAGDVRSLRLGEGGLEEANQIADAVVTELGQIPGLLEQER